MVQAHVTTGGRARVLPAQQILSKGFEANPTITYILSSLTAKDRLAYLPTFFNIILDAAALNNATFEEVDEWGSCGVMMPPGCHYDSTVTMIRAGILSVLWTIGLSGCRRLLWEMSLEACKKKALTKDEKYYYVIFLGTREDARGKGLCSDIVRHYQPVAAKSGHAIYLEAADEYSWGLYKKLGFITVDEIVFGKGEADTTGILRKGGPGVKIWGMVWRPEKHPR